MKTIKHSCLAFFLILMGLRAQEKNDSLQQVIGTVKDINGNPIQEALILIDSVNMGDIHTNDLGQFTVKIPHETKLISVYSKSYGILNQSYGGEDQIHFTWSENPIKISKSKLKAMGYAIRTPKNEGERARKTDYTKYQNIYQMLVAEVPGVVANGNTIQLRGTNVSSINSGVAPLFIVDGTPTSSIEFINPVEVKSFRVIRDEGASVYGVRGANGVVIIELKK